MTDKPPDGIDPVGLPGNGHRAFVMTLAVVVALLALIVTLGWVVYHKVETPPPSAPGTRQGLAVPPH